MIAELFYPKELKEVIADLRAKDDLNGEALRTLNWPIDVIIFPLFVVNIFFLFKQIHAPTVGYEVPIFNALLLVVYMPFYVRGLWRTYHASYIFGKKTKGTISNITFFVAGITYFDVTNNQTYENHRVCTAGPITFRHPPYLTKIGDKISYYLMDNKRYHPNPDIYEYMKKHCLKTSLLKGD